MIGRTISHYPALRDLPLFWIPPIGGIPGSGTARRDKIIEKLGEALPRQAHIWPIGGGLANDLGGGL